MYNDAITSGCNIVLTHCLSQANVCNEPISSLEHRGSLVHCFKELHTRAESTYTIQSAIRSNNNLHSVI